MTRPGAGAPPASRLALAGVWGPFLYVFCRAACAAIFRVLWRRRVVGLENIPASGSVILAANHASFVDPPLVGSALRRRVYFMAKQELFDTPLMGWLIKQLNAFPIRRVERDMGAFRMAQRILAAGEALILFPEGTRQRDGRLGRARPGVGMLALKTHSPVVPIYVHNSHRAGKLAPLAVVFGPPIQPGGGDDYQAFSEQVMAAIARLKEAHFGAA